MSRPKSVTVRFPSNYKDYHYLTNEWNFSNPEIGDFVLTNKNFGIAYPQKFEARVKAGDRTAAFAFANDMDCALITDIQYGTPHPRATKEYVLLLKRKFFILREENVVAAFEDRRAKAKAQEELDRLVAEFAQQNVLQQLIASNPEARRLFDLVNS